MLEEREILTAKKPTLLLRSSIMRAIRFFFEHEGFLEVQTPVRTPAPAPEPHIDAIPADGWFLSTSPELYMKRLLAAGYEKIFQLAPCFRRGERGRLHHPEFCLLEWYRLGSDYQTLKRDCLDLLRHISQAVNGSLKARYQGSSLDLESGCQHITVREAFLHFAGWDPISSADPDRFDLDLVEKVEPRLGFPMPCILSDYPPFQAALARLKPGDPTVAERFELYWAGIELANGFSELTDSREQRERFLQAMEARSRQGRTVYPIAESFLASIEHLPPCTGIALGVDRLMMIFADAVQLDQVVAFPPDMA
ncbi:MAG: EF-P lysine aminoacylase EpmA [Desulforhabdus sp.]|jgi:lysyl-tRNA synthetase class 2|nr:EF-P lysine aminoacylase EpmA [Desulforhabdus sp.]